MDTYLQQEKQAILASALPLVPFEGWSDAMLANAVQLAGYDAFMAYRCFPEGAKALIGYYCDALDAEMEAALATKKLGEMRIRDRIATAVETRLSIMQCHKEAVRQLSGYFALPWNAGQGAARTYKAVDAMWVAAGDASTDFNFYSKRGLLAAVYASTLMYWLNDASENWQDTRAFLRRRIDNVLQIPKLKAKVKQAVCG